MYKVKTQSMIKKTLKRIIVFLLLLISFNAQAQQTFISYDTTYIKSNRSDFVISILSKLNYHNLILENNIVNKIEYYTNSPSLHGVSVDYKWLTLEYTRSFDKYASETKGKTVSNFFSFGYTGRKIWFTNYWHSNKGYNLKIKDINTSIVHNTFRNDISTKIYHASLQYGFNNKEYSNMAALWQLEQQRKSAGSFSAGLTYTRTSLENNKSIIPDDKIIIFKDIAQYKTLKSNHYGANVGYMHTFVPFKHNRIFLSLGIVPGILFQKSKVQNFKNSQVANSNKIAYDLETFAALGYNNSNWFVSLRYIGHRFHYIISDENKLTNNYYFVRLAFGFKLKTKLSKYKFLKYIGL